MNETIQITRLLGRLVGGDRMALEQLFPLVYEQLRKIAANQLKPERKDHTLNATALVHEAYLKLVNKEQVNWQNRAHFYAVAAQAMRRILVDYARRRKAEKRGGGDMIITLNEELVRAETRAGELLELNDALNGLKQLHERQSKVVELRFFGGLTEEEIAEVLGISPATVKRDWRMARAWLAREMRTPLEGSDLPVN